MSIGLKSNKIELIVGTDVELCFMYDVNVWEIIYIYIIYNLKDA